MMEHCDPPCFALSQTLPTVNANCRLIVVSFNEVLATQGHCNNSVNFFAFFFGTSNKGTNRNKERTHHQAPPRTHGRLHSHYH